MFGVNDGQRTLNELNDYFLMLISMVNRLVLEISLVTLRLSFGDITPLDGGLAMKELKDEEIILKTLQFYN